MNTSLTDERSPRTLPAIAAGAVAAVGRSFPRMLEKVRMMVADPACSAQLITSVILSDPILTALVLSRTNAAMPRKMPPVTRVSGGATYLGVSALHGICQEVVAISDARKAALAPCWSAANAIAALTRLLAKHARTKPDKMDDESLYVHGLLSTTGCIFTVLCHHQKLDELRHRCYQSSTPPWALEREIIGLSASDIGALVAKAWRLPPSISEVVRYHQQPQRARHDHELVSLVHIARILAHGAGFSPLGLRHVQQIAPFALESTGLSGIDLGKVIGEFYQEQEEISLYESIYSGRGPGA